MTERYLTLLKECKDLVAANRERIAALPHPSPSFTDKNMLDYCDFVFRVGRTNGLTKLKLILSKAGVRE